jgi:hypothetical protein
MPFFESPYVSFEVLFQVFFGAVQCSVGWEWRRQFVTGSLLAVSVDIDVEPIFGHIVGCLTAPTAVMVVSDYLDPLVGDEIEGVLQLEDKPNHIPSFDIDP